MCGQQLGSLADTILAVHETALEDIHSGVVFHLSSCVESFQVCDTGVEGTFDAESYILHEFIPEDVFRRLESHIDLGDISEHTWIPLWKIDPELQMDAAWLRDGRHRVALVLYDDAGCSFIEPVAKDTEDPLHQALLKYFTKD
jgi:hypothetical protein